MTLERRTFLAAAAALVPTWSFAAMDPAPSVVELRQYTLHGGRRDELIALFEAYFMEPQAAVGAPVLGAFRDLDDPDRFVWLRGFTDMAARKTALTAFYGGPAWLSHRDAANATMRDSDNVLLLAPLSGGERLFRPVRSASTGVLRVAIHSLRDVAAEDFATFFDRALEPLVTAAGGRIMATLASERAPNDFRLPVREHDPVFVWMARFDGLESEEAFTRRMARASGWRDCAPAPLLPALMRKPEILRLSPTDRSPIG